jgi:hypothetical protein
MYVENKDGDVDGVSACDHEWIVRVVWLAAMLVIPLACAGKHPQPKIEFVQPPPDRAYVYVYRLSGSGPTKLWLDGASAGTLWHKTFAFFQVRPGEHALVGGREDVSGTILRVIGGEVVYLQVETTTVPLVAVSPLAAVIAGDRATLIEIQRVSRREGREGVRECRLILDEPPPLPPMTEP